MKIAVGFLNTVGVKRSYTKLDAETYVHKLQTAGRGGTYIRLVVYALKRLYRFLNSPPLKFERGELPRRSEPQRTYLSAEEMERVRQVALDAIRTAGVHPQYFKPRLIALRNYCMYKLALLRFPRSIELTRITLGDYNPDTGSIKVPTAKQGYHTMIPVDGELKQVMSEYLELRGRQHSSGFLFVTQSGQQITTEEMLAIIKQLTKKAGVWRPRIGWHSLRRSMCTELHARGMSEKELTDLGGWRSPKQVFEYIRTDPRRAAAKAATVNPFHEDAGRR